MVVGVLFPLMTNLTVVSWIPSGNTRQKKMMARRSGQLPTSAKAKKLETPRLFRAMGEVSLKANHQLEQHVMVSLTFVLILQ